MGIYRFVLKNKLGFVYKNKTFKDITTMKVGGPIKYYITPNNINNLMKIIKYINKKDKKYFVIGNGSNIIASEKKYNGIIITLKKIEKKLEIKENNVSVSANYNANKLVLDLAKENYTNLEFMYGIPGVIGGLVAMNSGAFDHVVSDYLNYVIVMEENGKILRLENKELDFSYRNSIFRNKKLICLEANFKIEKTFLDVNKKIEEIKRKREEIQPLNYSSCGSVFKNPKHYKSWELIDLINYRGKRCGGASFSCKHANFIINHGNAKTDDILILINEAKKQIKKQFKIDLESEIIFVNL